LQLLFLLSLSFSFISPHVLFLLRRHLTSCLLPSLSVCRNDAFRLRSFPPTLLLPLAASNSPSLTLVACNPTFKALTSFAILSIFPKASRTELTKSMISEGGLAGPDSETLHCSHELPSVQAHSAKFKPLLSVSELGIMDVFV
ncbi:unnamed protein product, partial [Meganyctiphanes norvegica]